MDRRALIVEIDRLRRAGAELDEEFEQVKELYRQQREELLAEELAAMEELELQIDFEPSAESEIDGQDA